MKMVKKILLGMVATAAIIGFAGCQKTVDDPKEAITGSNNDYAVDFENTEGDNYRAYKSTNMNHAGALVKVTFDKKDVGASKMGVIFDLHDSADVDEGKDFYIIGVGTLAEKNFYVSKFTGIVDIQANNFGAPTNGTTGPNGEKEVEIVPLTPANSIDVPEAEDGSVTYYVYFKAFTGGYYEWAVLDLTEEKAKTYAKKMNTITLDGFADTEKLASNKITGAFTPVDSDLKIPQNQLAVYAMISPNKTLTGTWKYLDMYKEAEEITE